MQLPNESIEEFKAIHKKRYGMELGDAEARESARNLMSFVSLLYDCAITDAKRKRRLKAEAVAAASEQSSFSIYQNVKKDPMKLPDESFKGSKDRSPKTKYERISGTGTGCRRATGPDSGWSRPRHPNRRGRRPSRCARPRTHRSCSGYSRRSPSRL